MLPDKPWKVDALARLFAGVLLSLFFINSAAASLAHYLREAQGANAPAYFAAFIASVAFFVGGMYWLQREWNFERVLLQAGLLFLAVYGSFILLWLAVRVQGGLPTDVSDQSTWRVAVAVLSFQGVALVLVHPFVRKHGMTWTAAFGLNLAPRNVVLIGIAIGISMTPLAWALQSFLSLLMQHFDVAAPQQEAVEIIRASSTLVNRIVLGITTVLIVPVAEEILFRGILYPWIKRIGFPRSALWINAVLFGLVHANLAAFIPLTALALVMTLLYERTGNLLAPIATHATFNAANFVYLILTEISIGPPLPE